MEEQSYLLKINELGQQAEKLEQQIQLIEEQLKEFEALKGSLEGIKNVDKDKEILTNLGKGIFVKTAIKENELFVNIGAGTLVKKSPEDTLRIVEDQLGKLLAGRQKLMHKIESLQEEMQNFIKNLDKKD